MSNNLSPMQQKVYNVLHDGLDTPMYHIAAMTYGPMSSLAAMAQARDLQQKLGPLISRINKKLKQEKKKIVPGNMKRTYRLVDIEG